MAFDVRIFGHRGVAQVPRVNPRQFSSDAVEMLYQPPEWQQKLTSAGATPVTSNAEASDKAQCIMVEVPDGEAIRYRIKPDGDTTVVDDTCPKLTGRDVFFWGPGWTFSFIEA